MATDSGEEARQLTLALIQAMDLLGLYRAELARVLHVHCGDVGALATGRTFLQPGTRAWQQARQFVALYQLLSDKMQHDEVKIYHWLRAFNPALAGTPLLLIVDDDRLQQVTDYLRHQYD